jgi:hypothetical protein
MTKSFWFDFKYAAPTALPTVPLHVIVSKSVIR